jgi:methylmalonyl-CoA mutase, C-terminal domain
VKRILLGKPGLDGHDRGAKVVARALRDAGYEVIYTGLHQTPEMIVRTAMQEDVAAIGLSILSGAHSTLVPRVRQQLIDEGLADVPLVVGGIIPAEDAAALIEGGVSAVFGPGTALGDIVRFFDEAVGRTPNQPS